MSISNTARLTASDVSSMNANFRRVGYVGSGGAISDLDINGDGKTGADHAVGLADYFGVSGSTVRSWLQPAGRNIIIQRDSAVAGRRFYGAIGKRVYCLQPPMITTADPRNSLRVRVFLAAALANGGLERIQVHTGAQVELHYVRKVLSGCLKTMDNIWLGGQDDYIKSGWTLFTITGQAGRWDLGVYYNDLAPDQGSDLIGSEEEEDDTQDNGAAPGCP